MSAVSIVAGIISLLITAVAVVLAVRAVQAMMAVVRAGRPAPGRTGDRGRRWRAMLAETLGHTRMLQWHWIGIMHWLVFAGFIFLSTAVLAAYFQVWDPTFALPLIGHFIAFEWVTDALLWLTLIGIVGLIAYRQAKHPRRLDRRSRFYGSRFWQAYFVEAIILGEAVAGLLIRGAEYRLADVSAWHFPLTAWIGDLYGDASAQTLETIIVVLALVKILLAMVWLAVLARNITMGVAWHRFTAWFNIYFKREPNRTALGALEPLYVSEKPLTASSIEDMQEEDFDKLGVGQVEDLSWKGLLDVTTCTECGRCQSQCPAWATDKPLSPKLLVMSLREHAYQRIPLLALQANDLTDEQQAILDRPLVGTPEENGVIDPDVLWSCTNCGACVQECPVDIEHVDHIDNIRRHQVLVESEFPSELNRVFTGMERKGNPWGMNAKDRMAWAKDLPFDVKVVGQDIEDLDEVDYLFWVGCAGAFDDRAKKTTRAIAELLHLANVSFAVLGQAESCTGDSARRAGNEVLFAQLVEQNKEVFTEVKVKKVIASCAHCFNTLKNEYRQFGVDLQVVHHTQLLNRLVREGRLQPTPPADQERRTITYHDPCFLGRHNDVYDEPRDLLAAIPGATLAEMPRNSERSFCCGAGGARMWQEEKLGSTTINRARTDEAIATGADQIAVGCPFCKTMLADGLTAAQSTGQAREEVEVLDVAQMLLASVTRRTSG